MSPGSTSALAPERGTGGTGDTPAHPPPLAPGSPWDVEPVWSRLVPPAPKRTQNVGHKPQKTTTGPLGPPGVTSHHPTPPQISLSVPLRGRLCPLSILPPLTTLDLEASHRTGCGRWLRPALVPVVPRQFLHKHWNLLDTGALFPARNAGVWPGKGAAVPGPTGSRTLELLLLLLAPQTPGDPGLSSGDTRRCSFNVSPICPLLTVLFAFIISNLDGSTPEPPKSRCGGRATRGDAREKNHLRSCRGTCLIFGRLVGSQVTAATSAQMCRSEATSRAQLGTPRWLHHVPSHRVPTGGTAATRPSLSLAKQFC